MDVSAILASHTAKFQPVTVEKETPLEVDPGLLTVTDLNPIDPESYNGALEEYLRSLARDGIQSLLATLFALPTKHTPDGPLAQLPPPTTHLPREKPLPKPKPLTKWQKFANAKGISHRNRDKRVWDEDKQEWVNRWGRDGKNREKESQWITEVPANADADYDPVKKERSERKARIAKNERQRVQNAARSEQAKTERTQRKTDIEKTLASTRISTASMGKFDRRLDGEKKPKGIKRKFDPTESSAVDERKNNLALLSKMDSDSRKMRRSDDSMAGKTTAGSESVLNVRKAVRFASKGRGGVALGRESAKAKGGKKGRGRGKR